MNRARLLDLLTSAALVGSEAQRSGALPLTRGDVTDYLLTYKVIRDALDAVDDEVTTDNAPCPDPLECRIEHGPDCPGIETR